MAEEVLPASPAALQVVAEQKQGEVISDAELEKRAQERRERRARFQIVQELVNARNPTQRDADKQLFLAGLQNDLSREDFRNRGWSSALNAAAIFAFWQELQPDAFSEE